MSLFLVGYVLAQLGVAWIVSRRTRTEDDYLVAGRSLGPGLAVFTIFATWFGAETCIGAAGAAYDEGLAGNVADPFGYSLCLLFMGLFFARRLWSRQLSTLGDLFRQCYGPRAEKFAAAVMIPGSVLWAAAQIRALGQVLSAASGWNADATVAFAAGVAIVYTCFGGLKADAVTDLIQGVMLVAGLVLLGAAVLPFAGADAVAAVRVAPAAGVSFLRHVESWAIPVCGSMFSAELAARVAAARSGGLAARASTAAAFLYVALGLVAVALGLAGRTLAPGLADGEQVLMHLAGSYLPAAGYSVFAGALVSAILSTVDSCLLAAGSLAAHNIVIPWRRIRDERAKVFVNRAAVVCCGLIAYVLGREADSVYGLVEEASAFGSAGIFVTVVCGLFTRVRSERAAVGALAAGAAAYGAGRLAGIAYPFLGSLAAAIVGLGLGAATQQGARKGRREIHPKHQSSRLQPRR